MNTTQISCFLTLADTLNFTKAAHRLFMTQPGLSRQISSLEEEINTLLFIRDQRHVRLTPAGALLARELPAIEESYNNLISRVQDVNRGYSDDLSIGILGGQWIGDSLADRLQLFMQKHPNINLTFFQGSFHDLRDWLNSGKIDVALTLKFDVMDGNGILIYPYKGATPVFAVSRHTALGRKEKITFEDLCLSTLILLSPDDSPSGSFITKAFLERHHALPAHIRYASNLSTLMLWINAGMGFGVINHDSGIVKNDSIRLIDEIKVEWENDRADSCLAWKKENMKPAIPMFQEIFS